LASKDWTGVPDSFIDPQTTPEQQARWDAAWQEMKGAYLGFFSGDEERERGRELIESEVPFNEPRGWARDVNQVVARDHSRALPTKEQREAVAHQFHRGITALREQAETDPVFFPSPVGGTLLQVYKNAMIYSRDGATAGHSVANTMQALVWPTVAATISNLKAVVLPSIARQRGQVSFEVWADRFREAVSDYLESFYKPLVSSFYRLYRLPPDGHIPADVSQLGGLFRQAQLRWSASPLSVIVDRRIAVVRNSEAHDHTKVDDEAETFTFINRDKVGVETDRWVASAADFNRLAIHVVHLGDVMKLLLLVMPLRAVGPEMALRVLSACTMPFLPPPPKASASAG
jgi:hypothetical protein